MVSGRLVSKVRETQRLEAKMHHRGNYDSKNKAKEVKQYIKKQKKMRE
jgi:hypothetical protein